MTNAAWPLVTVKLRDAMGEASACFTREELGCQVMCGSRLSRLWDDFTADPFPQNVGETLQRQQGRRELTWQGRTHGEKIEDLCGRRQFPPPNAWTGCETMWTPWSPFQQGSRCWSCKS